MTDVLQQIARLKLVPVIVIDDAAAARPLAEALLAGGLPIAEVTFRTAAAAEAIAAMSAFENLLVGAGTVLSVEQADRAIDAGARFIVAPGTSPRVVERCLERGVTVTPGVATPTDIELAMSLGLTTLKFFPAEPLGGIKMLKAISAPYGDVRFIPTGGITAESLPAYLALKSVIACGGSWVAPQARIAAGDFAAIETAARHAIKVCRS